jgi:hypothetical protein
LAFVSRDGTDWERVEHPAFGGEGRQGMTAVAAGPRGVVAVGFDSVRGPTPEDAAVWYSPDGRTWERVLDPDLGGQGVQTMTAVAATTTGGFVAVGAADSSRTGIDAAVWASPGGREWQRVANAALASEGNQSMAGVVAIPGAVVAVGTDETANRSQSDAAVWLVAEGSSWERIRDPDLGGADRQAIYGVAYADSTGLVAVGSDVTITGHEGVWTSPDGRSWEHVSAGFADPGLSVMYSLAIVPTGVVAVGREFHGDTDYGNAGVWRSADGRGWQQLKGEPALEGAGEQVIWDITPLSEGFLAVGAREGAAAVWRLP